MLSSTSEPVVDSVGMVKLYHTVAHIHFGDLSSMFKDGPFVLWLDKFDYEKYWFVYSRAGHG